jgi:hypothetical protein
VAPGSADMAEATGRGMDLANAVGHAFGPAPE